MSVFVDLAESILGFPVGPLESIIIYIVAYTLFLVVLDGVLRLFLGLAGAMRYS